jgi:hypothetical protein
MSYTYSYPVTSRRNTYSDYQTARRPKSIVVYPHATVVQPPSPRIIHTSPRKDGKHKRSRKSSVVIQEAPREHVSSSSPWLFDNLTLNSSSAPLPVIEAVTTTTGTSMQHHPSSSTPDQHIDTVAPSDIMTSRQNASSQR